MTKKQFRVGSIKTMHGLFTEEAFHEQFVKKSSDTHVFVFGGHTGHTAKNLFAPLAHEKSNLKIQFVRELETYDIPNCALPVEQEARPGVPIEQPEALAKKALPKLFYTVGFGGHLVLPMRRVNQHDSHGRPKFDMPHELREMLVHNGILKDNQWSLDFWDGVCSDAPDMIQFARAYADYAHNCFDMDVIGFLGEKWAATYYRPYQKRCELHHFYVHGLIALNKIIHGLAECDTEQKALEWLHQWKNAPKMDNDPFSDADYDVFVEAFKQGMADKKAVQENRLDNLKDPTVACLREDGPLTVRMCKPSSVPEKKRVSDKKWQEAIAWVGEVSQRIQTVAPVKVIRPMRDLGKIEVGFAEPREWLLYHPADKSVTVSRHCTHRSFRMVIEMAMTKKMKWIDVANLPQDQVDAIKEQIQLLNAKIVVRDAGYKAKINAMPIQPQVLPIAKIMEANAPVMTEIAMPICSA